MRPIKSSIAVSVAALALSASAYGQDAGAGLRIAEAECAGCHAVGREGRKPCSCSATFSRIWSQMVD